MQSSERVSRVKVQRKHWDDEGVHHSKKSHHSDKSSYRARQDLENYFEQKRLKAELDEVWDI
ncbi:PA3496 family putative envelope integrity protein [Aliikangiella sp. IMCC44653]